MFARSGLRVGSLFGVQILLDWSLIVIFALLTVSLGGSVFPAWHPDWSPLLVWGVALAAAVLFFLSILLHELSHALVAKAYGIPVDRITLFLFGGVANIEHDPDSPLKEALMAGIGPVTSVALGIGFSVLAAMILGLQLGSGVDPITAMHHMGPTTTLLAWLGPVNILLGVFNMLPGFPLDGGRVLRAALWAATGNLRRATRWATQVGRAFGLGLIVIGISMGFGFHYPVLGGGIVSGLWLAFIGWFLTNAARSSYQQLLLRQSLEHVAVSRLMQRELPPIVPAETPIATLVDRWVLHRDDSVYPVGDGERIAGFVQVADIRGVPKSEWQTRSAGELAGRRPLPTTRPDEDVYAALQRLGRENADALVVMDGEQIAGLLRRRDIERWLSLEDDETRLGTGRWAGSRT